MSESDVSLPGCEDPTCIAESEVSLPESESEGAGDTESDISLPGVERVGCCPKGCWNRLQGTYPQDVQQIKNEMSKTSTQKASNQVIRVQNNRKCSRKTKRH